MSNAAPTVANVVEARDVTSPPDRLVTGPELRTLFGIPYSREHLYRLAVAGEFPSPLRLGGNRIAYKLSEILKWIDSRPRAVTVRQRRSARRG